MPSCPNKIIRCNIWIFTDPRWSNVVCYLPLYILNWEKSKEFFKILTCRRLGKVWKFVKLTKFSLRQSFFPQACIYGVRIKIDTKYYFILFSVCKQNLSESITWEYKKTDWETGSAFNYVQKIIYQFLYDWHNCTYMNTTRFLAPAKIKKIHF